MEPLGHPDMPENSKKTRSNQQIAFIAIAVVIVLLACGFAYQSWQISQLRAQTPSSVRNAGSDALGESVSAEKTALIKEILRLNSALDAKALAELSEEELRQLQAAGAPGMLIGLNTAAYAAEEYAGTLAIDSVTWTGELKLDETPPHYEIQLHITKGDFNYKVDAFSGKILSGAENICALGITLDPDSDLEGVVSVPYPDSHDIPEAPDIPNGINRVQAMKNALYDANLAEEDTEYCNVWLEYDDGYPEYKVEFYANGVEYEYEIDAYTGGILKSQQETGYVPPSSETLLTTDQAAAIAYADAGVEAANITNLRTKLDWDDGVRIYEVEFICDGTKYKYELNAVDGTIRKSEQEAASRAPVSQSTPDNSSASYTYIGSDAAKAAAFQHAGINANEAKYVKCELDKDHGLACYEIEFTVGRTEYEYEVDAVTGAILKAEID